MGAPIRQYRGPKCELLLRRGPLFSYGPVKDVVFEGGGCNLRPQPLRNHIGKEEIDDSNRESVEGKFFFTGILREELADKFSEENFTQSGNRSCSTRLPGEFHDGTEP